MTEYFRIEESPYNPNRYVIRLVHDNLPLGTVRGSCNVLAARVCGLSWAEYLRMCRDIYGAELVGKNEKYPVAYFPDIDKAKQLTTLLNKQVSTIFKPSRKNTEGIK